MMIPAHAANATPQTKRPVVHHSIAICLKLAFVDISSIPEKWKHFSSYIAKRGPLPDGEALLLTDGIRDRVSVNNATAAAGMSLPTRSIRPRAPLTAQKHAHGGVTIPTDIAYDQNVHQVTLYGGMPFVMDDDGTRTPG
jgi:hypothetical protein